MPRAEGVADGRENRVSTMWRVPSDRDDFRKTGHGDKRFSVLRVRNRDLRNRTD